MRTFSVTTLGCKVNQYEGEQIALALRQRGLRQVSGDADLRIVHTCSVTVQAASKSRQMVRRQTKQSSLNVLQPRVVVSGCWATSHREEAAKLTGVNAVLSNDQDAVASLNQLVDRWLQEEAAKTPGPRVIALPQFHQPQTGRQRALLKIQDGCDAHCTYCIIPTLRPKLSSKPVSDAILEARRLVDAGHQELVLTGIFLGAYGQPTALRRRQTKPAGSSLDDLVDALCGQVRGLRRLRLSSLEPGDLTDDLLHTLRSHSQVVPHFHLPLQSGSDRILRRMNRQYSRDDFLRMLERVQSAFDRPALTTDVIVGFPGETDVEFAQSVEMCRRAGFIHIHAFSFSPRPGTAAARWSKDFVRGPVVNDRINHLTELAANQSLAFRQSFLGQTMQVLVESPGERQQDSQHPWHGRTERYFPVHFQSHAARPGMVMDMKIEQVTPARTIGSPILSERLFDAANPDPAGK